MRPAQRHLWLACFLALTACAFITAGDAQAAAQAAAGAAADAQTPSPLAEQAAPVVAAADATPPQANSIGKDDPARGSGVLAVTEALQDGQAGPRDGTPPAAAAPAAAEATAVKAPAEPQAAAANTQQAASSSGNQTDSAAAPNGGANAAATGAAPAADGAAERGQDAPAAPTPAADGAKASKSGVKGAGTPATDGAKDPGSAAGAPAPAGGAPADDGKASEGGAGAPAPAGGTAADDGKASEGAAGAPAPDGPSSSGGASPAAEPPPPPRAQPTKASRGAEPCMGTVGKPRGSRFWTPGDRDRMRGARKKWPDGYIAFCAIVKDQPMDLRYWIAYHRWLGVDKFYIKDNNSSRSLLPYIMDYAREGIVEYEYFIGRKKIREHFDDSNQWRAYHNCIAQNRHRHAWMGFMDADEFIVFQPGRHPAESLPELTTAPGGALGNALPMLLHRMERIRAGALALNWVLFGSSGHVTRPVGGPLASYTKHLPQDHRESTHTKVIGYLPKMWEIGPDPHTVYLHNGWPALDASGNETFMPRSDGARWDTAVIYHYVLKSKAEYASKMARGSGAGNVKTTMYWDYIEMYANETCTHGAQVSAKFMASRPRLRLKGPVEALPDPVSMGLVANAWVPAAAAAAWAGGGERQGGKAAAGTAAPAAAPPPPCPSLTPSPCMCPSVSPAPDGPAQPPAPVTVNVAVNGAVNAAGAPREGAPLMPGVDDGAIYPRGPQLTRGEAADLHSGQLVWYWRACVLAGCVAAFFIGRRCGRGDDRRRDGGRGAKS